MSAVPTVSVLAAIVVATPVLTDSTTAQGRIVVAHDEWTLSATGFSIAPSAAQFAQNIASWFASGQPGAFRAWSDNFGVTQSQLAVAMTAAGHSWTVSTAGTFDLATLQQYDGIFVVGDPIDAAVLTQYVLAGGNVYVAAGTGGADPAQLNPFLQSFGLQLGGLNGASADLPIANLHPIFAGVTSLYHDNGNSIGLTGAAGGNAQILVSGAIDGYYAVYDPAGATANTSPIGAGCGGLSVVSVTRPVTGTSWDLALNGIPTAGVFGVEIFGASDPGVDDLVAIGMPGCGLRASLDVLTTFAINGSTHAYGLAIPAASSLIGIDVHSTCAVFETPPSNPFGAITGNGVLGTIGNA